MVIFYYYKNKNLRLKKQVFGIILLDVKSQCEL